jgi:hypothetical protein
MKAPFHSYSFKEQALSINGRISDLEKAVRAHMRRAASEGRGRGRVEEKCANQIQRMLERIRG